MRRALLIALALAGCAPIAGAVREDAAPANLVPNAGFSAAGDRCPALWTCAGPERFVTAGERGGALRLAVPSEGLSAEAASPPIPVRGGPHEILARLRFEWPEGEPPGEVAARFGATLELLDADGEAIPTAGGRRRIGLLASLAGVRTDDAEGWFTLHLTSGLYPSQPLEFPPAARAARLRFALGRPGEMLVDDLVLRRSKFARTLRVRTLPFLADDESAPVFPTPREIALGEARVLVADPAAGRVPCATTGPDRSGAAAEALAQLSQTLTLLAGRPVRVPEAADAAREKGLACAAILDLRLSPGMGAEEYAIEANEEAETPWVTLAAGGARGLYYAVTTFAQLLEPDPSGAGPVRWRAAAVRDWPAYGLRGVSGFGKGSRAFDREVELARWAPSVKLNAFFFNYPALGERWWAPEADYWRAVAKLGEERRAHGLFELGALANVYYERAFNPEADFLVSHKGDLARATDLARRLAEAGATHLMACADDFTPTAGPGRYDYGLRSEADRERFGALAPAHATLLGELARAAGPGVALSFVTPWYNGLFLGASRERAEAYLAELGGAAPAGVPTVWTGPAVRSLFVDRPGVTAYKRLVGADRPALYWDNTLYARAHRDYWLRSPDRAHRASWLEPFDVDFYEGAERDFAGMYVNGHAGELYRIKYMTAADFLWNPEAYLPERSLARALVALYGRDFAGRLLSWDERYWATRERANRFRAGLDSEPPTRDAEALAAELAEMRAHPDAEPRLLDELSEKLAELDEDDPT